MKTMKKELPRINKNKKYSFLKIIKIKKFNKK
jgi:hypothetical protein